MTFMFSRDRVLFVTNLGAEPVALDGWRFSSSSGFGIDRQTDADGLNGIVIGPLEAVRFYLNDDAPNNHITNINVSEIGGFAPHDVFAYAISLYFPDKAGVVDFDDGLQMADHMQWSIHGVDDEAVDERSDEAEAGGVWTDQSAWIDFRHHAYAIESTTFTPAVYLHGPEHHNVIVIPCESDVNDDGRTDIFDVLLFIKLYESGDLRADLFSNGVLDIFDVLRFVDVYQLECFF
jgi:hypothetical protein